MLFIKDHLLLKGIGHVVASILVKNIVENSYFWVSLVLSYLGQMR
jgi:hypothetical protein